jgi:Putative DNA-binding domain
MLRPLNEWDDAYLSEIDASDEKALLEKKQSAGFNPDIIAKQVCAFANAGGGFIVFGMKDKKDGGGLDSGIPGSKGREPIKAWVEKQIPDLHEPPIVGCEARLIERLGCHVSGNGLLVIHVPSSDRRPHWVKASEEAYLRVGEHSAPMRIQTILDISSRGVTPTAIIEDIGIIGPPSGNGREFSFNPLVRVESGPVCRVWGFQITVPQGVGEFRAGGNGRTMRPNELLIDGVDPLFPKRSTRVGRSTFGLILRLPPKSSECVLSASLHVESSFPVERTFNASTFPE